MIMIFIQAGTGWHAPVEKGDDALDTDGEEN
jgi:hypothetical protein